MEDLDLFLNPTEFLDYNSKAVQNFIGDTALLKSNKEKTVELYLKVRDAFLYDPYHLDLRPTALKASTIIGKKRAWCVEKCIVLAACARALNIPCKLAYANVINHIGIEKLYRYLKHEEIVFHGYVELYINNKWVKCSPTFDKRVCSIAKVEALDFNGEDHALLQAYSGNQKFMEYTHFYGSFDNVPIELMNSSMQKYYPHLYAETYDSKEFSFKHI